MGLNYFFCALKCPLNLKFYDSDETIALPENKIHTWLGSKHSLESTSGPLEMLQDPQDSATGAFSPESCQQLVTQTEAMTSKGLSRVHGWDVSFLIT